MSHKKLVKEISKITDFTIGDINEVIEAFRDVLMDKISKGENITIPNVGTFSLLELKPRKAMHFGTGEVIDVIGSKKVKFTPSIALRNAVKKL